MTVVSISEENSSRYFKNFESENVQQTGIVPTETDRNEQQVSERVWQIYESFLKAGLKKQKMDSAVYKSSIEVNLNNEDIAMMISKCPTIEFYNNFYFEDMEIELDNEKIFPSLQWYSSYIEYGDLGDFTELK